MHDAYRDSVTIATPSARVVIAPALGGTVLRYDWLRGGEAVPLFRPTPGAIDGPIGTGFMPMVPWVNRISAGAIAVDGVMHPLPLNLPGDRYPIHGNGFQSAWTIESQSATRVVLALESEGPGPYRYSARLAFTLEDAALTIALSAVNRAASAMPFALGLHPWMPRTPATTLMARGARVWLEDATGIPHSAIDPAGNARFDFADGKSLPADLINNGYSAWDGAARILWPERRAALAIDALEGADCFHVYSPGDPADFLCFEPTDCITDGFRLVPSGEPGAGLVLQPGGEGRIAVRFAPGPFAG